MPDSDTIAAKIAESLREDREEGLEHDEVVASDGAVAACQQVGRCFARLLKSAPGLKWAAFGETGGGASFVMRSEVTDRRVDFGVSADGKCARIIQVSRKGSTVKVSQCPIFLPLVVTSLRSSSTRSLAEWVAGERS